MPDCYDPTGVAPLMKQLKSQRLIKILIGDATEAYLMSETLLTNASEYFAKAIRHETSMGNTEPGVLSFPDDGDYKGAWEVLLFWLMTKSLPLELTSQHGEIPDVDCYEPWTRIWVLADKYLLPELQDAVMLEMLYFFEGELGSFLAASPSDGELVNRLLRISPVDSPLRRLIAEEVVRSLYGYGGGGLRFQDLLDSDGTTGLSASLVVACHDYMLNGKSYLRWRGYGGASQSTAWKEYLVGDVPTKHWVSEHLPELYPAQEEEGYEEVGYEQEGQEDE
ncbi:hypothetical protein PRZ48_013934 [Zasmidium cellare]|uniref:BTB domain-containing protein n=1 Tax=Zasmidium cellare TaxID=395010 RepID=A0ABR0E091_ZASCE|nr:hypothetical protein PRZ48_013934 [Zasmidium cellare]